MFIISVIITVRHWHHFTYVSASASPYLARLWPLCISWGYIAGNGNKNVNSSTAHAYGAAYKAGDTVTILLDFDASTIEFLLNGATQGVAFRDLKYVCVPSDDSLKQNLKQTAMISLFLPSKHVFSHPTFLFCA